MHFTAMHLSRTELLPAIGLYSMAGVLFWFFFVADPDPFRRQAKKNKARRRRYALQPKHNYVNRWFIKVQGSKVQACPVGVHHLLITHHS